jgi:hypothetical protein
MTDDVNDNRGLGRLVENEMGYGDLVMRWMVGSPVLVPMSVRPAASDRDISAN